MNKEYISQSELGRLSKLNPGRISALVRAGLIKPDFQLGRCNCFRSERVAEIVAIANGNH